MFYGLHYSKIHFMEIGIRCFSVFFDLHNLLCIALYILSIISSYLSKVVWLFDKYQPLNLL